VGVVSKTSIIGDILRKGVRDGPLLPCSCLGGMVLETARSNRRECKTSKPQGKREAKGYLTEGGAAGRGGRQTSFAIWARNATGPPKGSSTYSG